MTRRCAVRILPLALMLSPCVTLSARAQRPDTAGAGISFQPPLAVGGFRKTGQEMLGPGEGVQLRYQRPDRAEWIDVYVYRVGRDPTCASACDSVAVWRQADEFASLIPELLRRGYYDSLRVDADSKVSLAAGSRRLPGRHLLLRGAREGRPVASHFYLVAAGEVLVKFRTTYPAAAAPDPVLEEFAAGFVALALRTVSACPGGEPQNGGLGLEVELASPLAEVRPRVSAALKRLGYVLDEGTPPDTWVTLPVHEWPAREEWSRVRTFTHPGVQIEVRARSRGAKTEMLITARTVCGLPEHREIETAVALIAASEVMMQFPEAERRGSLPVPSRS